MPIILYHSNPKYILSQNSWQKKKDKAGPIHCLKWLNTPKHILTAAFTSISFRSKMYPDKTNIGSILEPAMAFLVSTSWKVFDKVWINVQYNMCQISGYSYISFETWIKMTFWGDTYLDRGDKYCLWSLFTTQLPRPNPPDNAPVHPNMSKLVSFCSGRHLITNLVTSFYGAHIKEHGP